MILEIGNRERQTLNAAARFSKSSTPVWREDVNGKKVFWANEGIPMHDSDEAELEYLDRFYNIF